MALADITIYEDAGASGAIGAREYAVASGGTPPAINAGEPVSRALGATPYVTAMATSKPVVGTDYLAGVAASTSTETASVDGTVQVYKLDSNQSYLISPKTAASWDTQAEYDALIGSRVTIDLTTGSYTLNASDGANNGCVVMPLNITKFPGKVRFAFRKGVDYLS